MIYEPLETWDTVTRKPHSAKNHGEGTFAPRDALTGLMERAEFLGHFSRSELNQSGRNAFVIIDLDHFKEINDRHGHPFGDRYLVAFAEQLHRIASRDCIPARIGGDEFAMKLQGRSARNALAIVKNIREEFLKDPICNKSISLGKLSIGIFEYGAESIHEFSQIYHRADVALYAAKATGRNKTSLYNSFVMQNFDQEYQRNIFLKAVEEDRLVPFFQPVYCLASKQIAGFEVLARIQDGEGSTLAPKKFAKCLSKRDCARTLTRVITSSAIASFVELKRFAQEDARLCLNLTEFDLEDRRFIGETTLALANADLSWTDITIEIVESIVLTRDADLKKSAIDEMRNLGANIALDDFGTGYASLYHLKNWNIDTIKIDKDFIFEAQSCKRSSAILRCLIQLSRDLEIKTIAEGIESVETERFLCTEGIKYGQGFFFSTPKSECSMMRFLKGKAVIRRSEAILMQLADHENVKSELLKPGPECSNHYRDLGEIGEIARDRRSFL